MAGAGPPLLERPGERLLGGRATIGGRGVYVLFLFRLSLPPSLRTALIHFAAACSIELPYVIEEGRQDLTLPI